MTKKYKSDQHVMSTFIQREYPTIKIERVEMTGNVQVPFQSFSIEIFVDRCVSACKTNSTPTQLC